MTHKNLNILFFTTTVILVGYIIFTNSRSKLESEINHKNIQLPKTNKLMEIHHQKKIKIHGAIVPIETKDILLNISGRIESTSKPLEVGTKFKKNEVLFKIERQNILYELLELRSLYKEAIQEVINNSTSQKDKWIEYLKTIQESPLVPNLPDYILKNEDEILNKNKVKSLLYSIKQTEIKLENYYYAAPYDGVITEGNLSPKDNIYKQKTILTIAKNGSFKIKCNVPNHQMERLLNQDSIYFISDRDQTTLKARLFKVETNPRNPDTSSIYFSFKNNEFVNNTYYTEIPSIPTTIPNSSIINDSVEIYTSKDFYKVGIKIMGRSKDSATVTGLPSHAFINLSPKK